jgi:hypothetical protein
MQEQDILPLAPALPVVMATTSTNSCAWCLKEQGVPTGEGSHGICAFHHAHMLLQAARRRAARAAQRQGRSVVTCQCKTTPGGTLICDACASKMIEVGNDQLGDESELPLVLTPNERAAMTSRVNQWLDTLKPQGEPWEGATV